MYTLIVDCSGFALGYNSLMLDTQGQLVSSGPVLSTDEILFAATSHPVTQIKLAGPTDFCLGLKDDIITRLATEYKNTTITVEVM